VWPCVRAWTSTAARHCCATFQPRDKFEEVSKQYHRLEVTGDYDACTPSSTSQRGRFFSTSGWSSPGYEVTKAQRLRETDYELKHRPVPRGSFVECFVYPFCAASLPSLLLLEYELPRATIAFCLNHSSLMRSRIQSFLTFLLASCCVQKSLNASL
jgi:hypothetical protein